MENCFYWRDPGHSARAGLHDLLRSSLQRIGIREVRSREFCSTLTLYPDPGVTLPSTIARIQLFKAPGVKPALPRLTLAHATAIECAPPFIVTPALIERR